MPTKSFLKGLGTGAINVSHQGLGPMGTKAMSLSLVVSYISPDIEDLTRTVQILMQVAS